MYQIIQDHDPCCKSEICFDSLMAFVRLLFG